jgi:butyrate kinase
MPNSSKFILVINPGSTSTKFAIFSDDAPLFVHSLRHSDEELAPFKGRPILEQHEFRRAAIQSYLARKNFRLSDLAAVVGRGGLLRPLPSGTYKVNERMLNELQRAPRGQHASNLGAFLAKDIADEVNVPAFIVDPVSVDEWPKRARLSGLAALPRTCLSHALNTKAVARRYSSEHNRRYEDLKLVIAHLGSGNSISAHDHGRMIDVTNSREEGPFSTERAGTVPAVPLIELCFSGNYTRQQLENMVFRDGGLYSYLGTKDLVEVETRIANGDEFALQVFDAMVYQIAKEIGAMSSALQGDIDAILITGGMANSAKLVRNLREFVGWIAPVHVYAGEDELQALAEGALRVLRGEESACNYQHAAASAD